MKTKLLQLLCCTIAVLLFAGLFVAAVEANAADDIRVILDGVELEFDVAPQIVDERTMVPMRAIFTALGAEIDWDGDTQTIVAVCGDTEIVLQIGNYVMLVNYAEITLDVAPFVAAGDRTLVPARAVAEGLGADVQWDGVARVVTITGAGQEAQTITEDETETFGEAVGIARHYFEQTALPRFVYGLEEQFITMLSDADAVTEERMELVYNAIHMEWFIVTANDLADIIIGMNLGFSDDNMEELTTAVINMQELIGLGPRHIVSITHEAIDGNTNAFILEMLNINEMGISTFIAIAYNENAGLWIFTLEQSLDFFDDGNPPFMLSFVEVGRRGNFGIAVENAREAFVEAVRYEMYIGPDPVAAITRP